jgi:23S rRNA (adenine2503-C2)-methyltransferase
VSAQSSLIGLDSEGLAAARREAGVEPKAVAMRTRQLSNWIYVHGARDFAAMTNLAKDFRERMAARFTLARP